MKKIISTTNAPAAIGPYSQAIDCGNFLVTSGQIPFDPRTRRHHRADPSGTDQHQGHPDGGRSDHGQRGEDHRVPAEHG